MLANIINKEFENAIDDDDHHHQSIYIELKDIEIKSKLVQLLELSEDIQGMIFILSTYIDIDIDSPKISFRNMRLITFALTWLKGLHDKHLTKFIVPYEHKTMIHNLVQRDLSYATCKQIIERCIHQAEVIFKDERSLEESYSNKIFNSIGKSFKYIHAHQDAIDTGYVLRGLGEQFINSNSGDDIYGIGTSLLAAAAGYDSSTQQTLSSLQNDENRGRYHYIPAPAKGSFVDKYIVSRETLLRKPALGSLVERREREKAYHNK